MTEAQRKWQVADRKRRYRAGLCRRRTCDRPRHGDHVLCKEHHDAANAASRAIYERQKKGGRCPGCGGVKLPEWTGVYCPTCQEAKLGTVMKRHATLSVDERRAMSASRRESARRRGACITCGDTAEPGVLRCRACQVASTDRAEATKDERRAAGVCIGCGGSRDDRFLNCSVCRARHRAWKTGAKAPPRPTLANVVPITSPVAAVEPERTPSATPIEDYRRGEIKLPEATVRFAEMCNGVDAQTIGDEFGADAKERNRIGIALRRGAQMGRLLVEGAGPGRLFYPACRSARRAA